MLQLAANASHSCRVGFLKPVHEAAGKKDLRSEETLTAAIWATMQGHAMFAIDDSLRKMAFKTLPETLVQDSLELLVESTARDTI